MTPDRWKRLEEICHSAGRVAPTTAKRLSRKHFGDDDDLKAQVESLLVHGEALSKLD